MNNFEKGFRKILESGEGKDTWTIPKWVVILIIILMVI